MKEIYYTSASEIVSLIKKRELSAVEVMRAHLERIDKVNPLVNGLVQQFPREVCLEQAREADRKVAEKKPLGKLHGLPVTIKDKHLVKGLISCVGCLGLKDRVAQEDSTVVTLLKKEGAIILGITNVPELLAAYETDNLVYGRTNNPYDLSRTPGGSSGGCAALVAAGCTPLSIGSDAAGSIRWPAHCTGIAGHKPTIGLVSRAGSPMGNGLGLFAYFSTSGPMARSVEDCALALSCLVGLDGIDPFLAPVPLQDPQKVDIQQLKVAYFIEDGVSEISSDVKVAMDATVNVLKDHVSRVELVELKCIRESHRLLWENFYLGGDRGQGNKNAMAALKVSRPSPLFEEFLKQAEKSDLTVTQFRNLFREISLFRVDLLEKLKDYDLVLSPVAATPAKRHGTTFQECRDMTHVMAHSLSGWPVTVVRCGTSSDGLPIGLQIAAKPWQDHLSLALGQRIEKLLGGWRAPTAVG